MGKIFENKRYTKTMVENTEFSTEKHFTLIKGILMIKKILSLSLGFAACVLALPSSATGCSPGQACGYVTFVNTTTEPYGIQVFDPAKGKVIAVSIIDGKTEEGDSDVTVKLYFPSNDKNKKLLFMACANARPNAVTGCDRNISTRCPYPFYKKGIITGNDPGTGEALIQCVH